MLTNGSREWALNSLIAASLIFVSSSVQAAEDTKLENLVRNAKVIKSAFPLTVERVKTEPDEVVVTTLLDPKAKPTDCKIDAMLVARCLIEGDKSVEKVLYRLKQNMSDSAYDQVLVRVSDVKAFGMKAINEQTLLSELDVVHREPKSGTADASASGSARGTTTVGGSTTTHGTATTDGAAPRSPMRQFLFRKSGDLKYAVATASGHRALSYAWLSQAASFLATVQKHGQVAPGSEAVFRQMESLSNNRNFFEAHRLGTSFQNALTKDTAKPNLAKAANPINYQQLRERYYRLLQNELGKDTPPDGPYFIERTKPIIRLKELDQDKANTAPLYAIYREAIGAYNRKDYTTMTDKLTELGGIFSAKYPGGH
jgi:hypothetical protein